MRNKKVGWGGRRAGAGRPIGTGPGKDPNSRRNRVAIMISDKELRVLKRLARENKIPTATMVYQLVERRLNK